MANWYLSWHDFIPPEVLDLLLKLIDDFRFISLVQVIFFEQNLCKTLQSQVWLIFFPEEDLS